MKILQHRFAIVHFPSQSGEQVMLHIALPADAASVAFADELQRLRRIGASGDLRVYRLDTNQITLHQRL